MKERYILEKWELQKKSCTIKHISLSSPKVSGIHLPIRTSLNTVNVPSYVFCPDIHLLIWSLWQFLLLFSLLRKLKLGVAIVPFSCCHRGNQDPPIYSIAFILKLVSENLTWRVKHGLKIWIWGIVICCWKKNRAMLKIVYQSKKWRQERGALGCVNIRKFGRRARVYKWDSERGWGHLLMGKCQGLRTGGSQRGVPDLRQPHHLAACYTCRFSGPTQTHWVRDSEGGTQVVCVVTSFSDDSEACLPLRTTGFGWTTCAVQNDEQKFVEALLTHIPHVADIGIKCPGWPNINMGVAFWWWEIWTEHLIHTWCYSRP